MRTARRANQMRRCTRHAEEAGDIGAKGGGPFSRAGQRLYQPLPPM